jgi:hypothetical protein
MDQLMALLIQVPPEARLREVGYPSEADLTDASAYPSCLVPDAITYALGTEAHYGAKQSVMFLKSLIFSSMSKNTVSRSAKPLRKDSFTTLQSGMFLSGHTSTARWRTNLLISIPTALLLGWIGNGLFITR